MRSPHGTITTFDVGFDGPFPAAINDVGVVAGGYFDESFIPDGSLRSQNGSITTLDVPGAVNGTIPWCLKPAGSYHGQLQ